MADMVHKPPPSTELDKAEQMAKTAVGAAPPTSRALTGTSDAGSFWVAVVLVCSVISAPIVLFTVIGLFIFGLPEPYHKVQDGSELAASSDGRYTALWEHGHWEPYFVAPPFYSEIWLKDNGDHGTKVEVFNESATVTWIDNQHLKLTVLSRYVPEVSLHSFKDVQISYHLGSGALERNYMPIVEEQTKKGHIVREAFTRSHAAFKQWARANTDNPD